MIPGALGSEITKIPPMDEVLRSHTAAATQKPLPTPSMTDLRERRRGNSQTVSSPGELSESLSERQSQNRAMTASPHTLRRSRSRSPNDAVPPLGKCRRLPRLDNEGVACRPTCVACQDREKNSSSHHRHANDLSVGLEVRGDPGVVHGKSPVLPR